MPVIFQKFIYRADMRANPNALYVFGDNVGRIGTGGQAREMRGEPNAIGVATKWRSGMLVNDFFYDAQFEETKIIIDRDIEPAVEALKAGRIVILPLDGIGTGYSQLPQRAPETYAYIQTWFDIMMLIERQ
jgi:hypothetical protein